MNLLRTKFFLIPHASRMRHSLDWPMPQVTYRHGSFDHIARSTSTFRVCLVGVKIGRMENRERKIWWKMTFFTVWLRGGGGEKSGGAHKFSLLPLQNTISPNWREDWSKKWKKYLNKTAPPLLTFLDFFFSSFDFSFVMLLFLCFCFLFFLSLVLLGGGFFFFSFFFKKKKFFFYYFFKKTLLDDFLCYFLKCPLSSIHNFFFLKV